MSASALQLKIEYRSVASLIPYVNNPRTHSDEQVALIAGSIRKFGFLEPVLVDGEAGLIAGHGRVMAARKLKMVEVPAIELSHLTPAERRAYVIAANQLALRAGWDMELLRLELGELDKEGFELGLLGFQIPELERLLSPLAGEGLTDPDDAPGIPTDPITVLGDVWLLGKHRIVCGDATDPAAVTACLNGVTPNLMVTDPPYGVAYDPAWRNRHVKRTDGTVAKGRAIGTVDNDDRADWTPAWALFPGDVAYVWHGGLHAAAVVDSLATAGFVVRSQIIWNKPHFAIGRGDYHWQHEPCWYAVRKGATGHWRGDRTQTTVWTIDSRAGGFSARPPPDDAFTGHGTQKPVECMQRPIVNNSSTGQAVYEPFAGSGTTIIAAERVGRVCHAIELNPAYVDVSVLRWQSFTGKNATLEATGKTFTETIIERKPEQVAKLGQPRDEKKRA